MTSSAACGGCGCGCRGGTGHCVCGDVLSRLMSPWLESPMTRTWTVCRQPVPRRDGERRWDQAYQLLVRWAGQGGLPGPVPITGEVPDACGGVCTGVDYPPGPGADHRAAA